VLTANNPSNRNAIGLITSTDSAETRKEYQAAGIREQVMRSFTTDVYNPFDMSLTRPTIEILIEYGLGVCVLTKGGTQALTDRYDRSIREAGSHYS
jgi:DNA repair photolyase